MKGDRLHLEVFAEFFVQVLLEIVSRCLPLTGVAGVVVRTALAASDEVARKAAGLAFNVTGVLEADEQAERFGVADLVVAVDACDQFHLVEQVVVMLHELAGVFPGGMILEDDECGLEVAWFQLGR